MSQEAQPPTPPTPPNGEHGQEAPGQPANSLSTQQQYFRLLLRSCPNDENIRFALGQVLHEMGKEDEAAGLYREGICHLDSLWLRRLPLFVAVSTVLAAALRLFGAPWLWAIVPVALAGPVLWFIVRQNRHKWVPQVAFWQRSNTVQKVDLAAEIERLSQNRQHGDEGEAGASGDR